MIDPNPPKDWKELQTRVARILLESGVEAIIEKELDLARGSKAADVWAYDPLATPPQTYVIECKLWNRPIPKDVVHSFRTVVGDSGANWGAIVAAQGFQSGAYDAAAYSNVRLLTWSDFEGLFEPRWFERYFLQHVMDITTPLIDYTEPINSRVTARVNHLSDDNRKRYHLLRRRYSDLATLCVGLRAYASGTVVLDSDTARDTPQGLPPLTLPISDQLRSPTLVSSLPKSIRSAASLRGLLEATLESVQAAVNEFDAVFGERV